MRDSHTARRFESGGHKSTWIVCVSTTVSVQSGHTEHRVGHSGVGLGFAVAVFDGVVADLGDGGPLVVAHRGKVRLQICELVGDTRALRSNLLQLLGLRNNNDDDDHKDEQSVAVGGRAPGHEAATANEVTTHNGGKISTNCGVVAANSKRCTPHVCMMGSKLNDEAGERNRGASGWEATPSTQTQEKFHC
jgi:hypothetical protein